MKEPHCVCGHLQDEHFYAVERIIPPHGIFLEGDEGTLDECSFPDCSCPTFTAR